MRRSRERKREREKAGEKEKRERREREEEEGRRRLKQRRQRKRCCRRAAQSAESRKGLKRATHSEARVVARMVEALVACDGLRRGLCGRQGSVGLCLALVRGRLLPHGVPAAKEAGGEEKGGRAREISCGTREVSWRSEEEAKAYGMRDAVMSSAVGDR